MLAVLIRGVLKLKKRERENWGKREYKKGHLSDLTLRTI
jgi:hypothetical protein